MDQNKTVPPTPEQLLRLLDLELASTRSHRRTADPRRRVLWIMTGFLLIIASCIVALVILRQMLTDLPRHSAENTAVTVEESLFP